MCFSACDFAAEIQVLETRESFVEFGMEECS